MAYCETGTPLSRYTTLEVGGPAHRLVEVTTCQEALAHWRQAQTEGLPLFVLGGGSNLLVSDQGFPGVVLRWNDQSLDLLEEDGQSVLVRVGGGWTWDDWVAECVARNWAGLECLSGIPGRVGAAPIQNIGAYGQEVAECIEACWVLEWETGLQLRVSASECAFGYRMSRFKQDWRGRFLVLAVEFRLRPGGIPELRYQELRQRMQGQSLDLLSVRRTVLEIRKGKSMVWDRSDPNHRSAGSFFVNPVVNPDLLGQLPENAPRWPLANSEQVKLSAAWLIEQSGFPKGWGQGEAGLSSNHVLALVNRGQARAQDLVRLAAHIRREVLERFSIKLHPEPEFLGFDCSVEDLLEGSQGNSSPS